MLFSLLWKFLVVVFLFSEIAVAGDDRSVLGSEVDSIFQIIEEQDEAEKSLLQEVESTDGGIQALPTLVDNKSESSPLRFLRTSEEEEIAKDVEQRPNDALPIEDFESLKFSLESKYGATEIDDQERLAQDHGQQILAPSFFSEISIGHEAFIRVLAINSGRDFVIRAKVNEEVSCQGLQIKVRHCLIEQKVSLKPVYKALVSIKSEETQKEVFNGWIFSQSKSFAQPSHENYFLALSQCIAAE